MNLTIILILAFFMFLFQFDECRRIRAGEPICFVRWICRALVKGVETAQGYYIWKLHVHLDSTPAR